MLGSNSYFVVFLMLIFHIDPSNFVFSMYFFLCTALKLKLVIFIFKYIFLSWLLYILLISCCLPLCFHLLFITIIHCTSHT